MTSLHLTRDRHIYTSTVVNSSITAADDAATPQSWMRNRLTVLVAYSILSHAAVTIAQMSRFVKVTA